MKNYIGIDLGTTNSAIATYDLNEVKIIKSPEQTDVTPSAIYIAKRGNRYYGLRAYNELISQSDDVAILFKRLLGTKKVFKFKSSGIEMTPEECSSEIIKVLLGYLPEEIKNDCGVIITVPANFDTMKKNATLEAAKNAGITHVALMQEPVAAVIASQRKIDSQGNYIIYDLGGGTFDVTIANSKNGKINLLANGGIDTCGGRDIDLAIYDKIIKPWLDSMFQIDYFAEEYKVFKQRACWAAENAKKELSNKNSSVIALDEAQAQFVDKNGNEVYLEINISRDDLDEIINYIVEETVKETLNNLRKADVLLENVNEIIFIGGPTNYQPLKEKVSEKLGVKYKNFINPMTAVAEGASIYAESIAWETQNHEKKSSIGNIKSDLNITFSYFSRVTTNKTNIIPIFEENAEEYDIEIKSLKDGWSSGRCKLVNKKIIEIPIEYKGENNFDVIIFNKYGEVVENKKITILKTLATVDSIPASHSIGIEVKDGLYTNTTTLEYLVEEGQKLPVKGTIKLKAADSLKAGENKKLYFKLWEGSDKVVVENNKFIGCLSISGTDFDYGMINKFSDIICKYEITDAGSISLNVEISDINCVFGEGQNFYSRQDAEIGIEDINSIVKSGEELIDRINKVSTFVDSEELKDTKEKVIKTLNIKENYNATEEDVQKAQNAIIEAKRTVSKEENSKNVRNQIRQVYLEERREFYESIKTICESQEIQQIDNLFIAAQRSIDLDTEDFDNISDEIFGTCLGILYWRDDSFAIQQFRDYASVGPFVDNNQAEMLIRQGINAINSDNINELRRINALLSNLKIHIGGDNSVTANIIKG